MNKALAAWINDINEDYLTDWANRGLLRRGRKLAENLDASICEMTDTHFQANIDGKQQTLSTPGFEHLSCSCPATAACHHLIAFLLCLQKHLALLAPSVNSEPETPVPWLAENFETLTKQLGAAHVKRAQRLLLQGSEITLNDNSGSLVAEIIERSRHTVRIPRSTGLAASTCTCAASRCVHRALAVLYARQQVKLYDPLAESMEALTPAQNEALEQIHDWLRELICLGTTGLSRGLIERGEALATVTRQADLPLLSSQIGALNKLQEDELAGRTFIATRQFRKQLAQIWLRFQALQTIPLVQPLPKLGGVHKRDYRLVQNLRLLGIGAECWRSKTDYLGLTLHFYAPEQKAWYRHTEARNATQAQNSDWSPEQCWRRESWAGTLRYQKIPGSELRLIKGWGTHEGQLSGREGTNLETVSNDDVQKLTILPIRDDFTVLAQQYSEALSADPVAPPPRLPVLIEITQAQQPVFTELDQLWTQNVCDIHDNELTVILSVTDTISAQALKSLNHWWQSGKRWRLLFGHLGLRRSRLSLTPISVYCHNEKQWRHPTLT